MYSLSSIKENQITDQHQQQQNNNAENVQLFIFVNHSLKGNSPADFAMPWKIEFELLSRLSGVSNSEILPASSTITRLLSRIVFNLCRVNMKIKHPHY